MRARFIRPFSPPPWDEISSRRALISSRAPSHARLRRLVCGGALALFSLGRPAAALGAVSLSLGRAKFSVADELRVGRIFRGEREENELGLGFRPTGFFFIPGDFVGLPSIAMNG